MHPPHKGDPFMRAHRTSGVPPVNTRHTYYFRLCKAFSADLHSGRTVKIRVQKDDS